MQISLHQGIFCLTYLFAEEIDEYIVHQVDLIAYTQIFDSWGAQLPPHMWSNKPYIDEVTCIFVFNNFGRLMSDKFILGVLHNKRIAV